MSSTAGGDEAPPDQPGDMFSRSLVAGFEGEGGKGHVSGSDARDEVVWEGKNWFSAAVASHHVPGPGELVEVLFDIFALEPGTSSNTNIGVVLADTREHAMSGLEGQQGHKCVYAVDTSGCAYFAGTQNSNTSKFPDSKPDVRVSLRLDYSGEDPSRGTMTVTPVGAIRRHDQGVTEIDEFPEGEYQPTVCEDLPPQCVPFVAVYRSRAIVSREAAMVKSAKKR